MDCLELYIFTLFMANSPFSIFQRADSFVSKLSGMYLSSEYDLVKLSRVSCVLLSMLQCAKVNNEKAVKQAETVYLDFEKAINLRDQNAEFAFLKPFFKEVFTTSMCLAPKCRLRTFLYNLAVTGDYYGDKLVELNGSFYTQYFHLVCFSFYKVKPNVWPAISHFTTQTVAKFKSLSERFEFSVVVLVRFINCYTRAESLQDGNSEGLRGYFVYLGQLVANHVAQNTTQVKSTLDLDSLELLQAEPIYSVCFYEEQHSSSNNSTKNRRFDQAELAEVLEKHVPTDSLKTCPDFIEKLQLVSSNDPSEKRQLLTDKIRDTFVGESVTFLLRVTNSFKVS